MKSQISHKSRETATKVEEKEQARHQRDTFPQTETLRRVHPRTVNV